MIARQVFSGSNAREFLRSWAPARMWYNSQVGSSHALCRL